MLLHHDQLRNRILAHRGWWSGKCDKNSASAFVRALEAGFGIETDIRDFNGGLVISHDPPTAKAPQMTLGQFLHLYKEVGKTGWLALNVKADGLALLARQAIREFDIENFFMFDMSVPDMRMYLRESLPVFTRRSDMEPSPSYFSQSAGVWLDALEIPYSPAEWISEAISTKRCCVVSPELHGRPHHEAWRNWRESLDFVRDDRIMICTDLPDLALAHFAH